MTPTPDRVAVTGIRARGHHGVLPAERETGQDFLVDVVLELDTAPAAAADDLAATVSYADLARDVHDVVAGPPVDLLETLAARVADSCLTDPRVDAVQVCVHKPGAPMPVAFSDVTVTIRRSRP